MVRDYEMVLVFDSQLSEEDLESKSKRYQDSLTQKNARIAGVDHWGVRKLAYEIGRHQQGNYFVFRFQSESTVISELERTCRLDESVLRHLIVVVDHPVESLPDEEAENKVLLGSKKEEEKTVMEGEGVKEKDEKLEVDDHVEEEL